MDDKREKNTANSGFLQNTSEDSKGATCFMLKNYASEHVEKKRLNLSNKARRKVSRNELLEEIANPGRIKRFRKVDGSTNFLIDGLRFVKFV